MRKLTILLGIGLCIIGIVFGPPSLIGLGVICLIGSSFLPDRAVNLFGKPLFDPGRNVSTLSSVGWLALGGGILTLTSVIGTQNNKEAIWPLLAWLCGLVLLCIAFVMHDRNKGAWVEIKQKWESMRDAGWMRPDLIFVAVLTAIAFYLRLTQLEVLPPMHGDEGEMGLRAMKVINPGESLAPFVTDFLDHPTLFHYLQALSIKLFGQSISGLRMVSVIFGALCVPALYVAGRLSYGRFAGLIAASFIAFAHVHIHFSRIGLNNIHSVFMVIVLFIFVLWCDRALKHPDDQQALTPWFLVGLITGLAQYFYYGSRLLPFLLLFWFAVILWRQRSQLNGLRFGQLSLILLGFLAGWSPLIPTFVRKPVTFIARQTGVSVFSDRNVPALLGGTPTNVDILLYQIERNVRFFIDSGDVSSFYFGGVPGLSTFAAILFWVGLGLALAQIKRSPNSLLLGWIVLGVGLGGVLTNTSPAATRLIMVYPAIGLLCGFAAETVYGIFENSEVKNHVLEYVLVSIMAVFLAVSGYQIYFQTYALNPPQSHMVQIGQAFAEQAADADSFLLGANIIYVNHGTISYLNQQEELRNLEAASDLPTAELAKSKLFFISVPPKDDQLELLRQQYPGGEFKQTHAPNGRLLFSSYLVDRP